MENTIRLAEISELKGIVNIFQSWRTVFPHVRQDYIKRKILASECVYQEGVVITFNRYKVKVTLGTVTIPKGSYIIHQIVNAKQGNGCASRVIDQLCDVVAGDNEDVYLTVRADNKIARSFYCHKGFEEAGEIIWANGTLPGVIYRKRLSRVFPGPLLDNSIFTGTQPATPTRAKSSSNKTTRISSDESPR